MNAYLETSVAGIYAAGDIARWPDPHSGENIRVEHWVVAERQGQTAARNMLGAREAFDAVPFFWSQHYDVPINYVGHAGEMGRDCSSTVASRRRDCLLRYKSKGRVLAVASIYRDLASLQAELDHGAKRDALKSLDCCRGRVRGYDAALQNRSEQFSMRSVTQISLSTASSRVRVRPTLQ